jgi:hypothetical protein
MGFLPLPELFIGESISFDQIESLITRTLAAQAGNILPRMNNNEITTSCEPSTIHPDLPMSGNHNSDKWVFSLSLNFYWGKHFRSGHPRITRAMGRDTDTVETHFIFSKKC